MNHHHNPTIAQWISAVPSDGRRLARLFCLPFAGGGSAIYYAWKERLARDIELLRIQLPGREVRLRERPFTRIGPLLAALEAALAPWLDRPYALYGHSMGALLAFELARTLRRRGRRPPAHLFVSGHRAPQLPRCEPISNLPDAQFIARLREYGGIPELVAQNDELMEIFLPILRADFEILDTYVYEEEHPLDCPLTAFGGASDPKASGKEIQAWGVHTQAEFVWHLLPGGHFFINGAQPALLEHINQDLQRSIPATRRQGAG